jgi:hypothetical protein
MSSRLAARGGQLVVAFLELSAHLDELYRSDRRACTTPAIHPETPR